MGSSRFPGKALADVCGAPALTRLLRRLRRSRLVDDVVLATSVSASDDVLEGWAGEVGIACHRGSEADVLRRVVEAQRMMDSDLVVEVTGDCILLDPEVIDLGIATFLGNECDVVTNTRRPSFPMGVDVQVFRRQDLEAVERTVGDPAVREHVSLYFYEHPARYRIIHLVAPARWQGPTYRFQLDYPEDHQFISAVYRRLEPRHGDAFGVQDILDLLRQEPGLTAVNRHCVEKAVR